MFSISAGRCYCTIPSYIPRSSSCFPTSVVLCLLLPCSLQCAVFTVVLLVVPAVSSESLRNTRSSIMFIGGCVAMFIPLFCRSIIRFQSLSRWHCLFPWYVDCEKRSFLETLVSESENFRRVLLWRVSLVRVYEVVSDFKLRQNPKTLVFGKRFLESILSLD